MKYQLYTGCCLDILPRLPSESIDCCVTSPPYWGLRDYGVIGQFGMERTPNQYVENLTKVFQEIWRLLKPKGTLWLNLGDTYIGYHGNKRIAPGCPSPSDMPGYSENMRCSTVGINSLKNKDLVGIPWRVAFALQEQGWWLRSDIVWNKSTCRPEKVRDRPVRCHEYLFLLAKSSQYNCDMRKASFDCAKRSVWSLKTTQARGHHAAYPTTLVEPCILAGSPLDGIVLDPFCGTGTTGEVALRNNRNFIGIDIKKDFITQTKQRLEVLNENN